MSVSYDYYRVFYYVATYRSFNKAAAVLSNSQPNISRSISILESQLGCKLFNRSHKGVTLTVAGEELFIQVEAAFKHLSAGEDRVLSIAKNDGGILKIGISVDITQSITNRYVIPSIIGFHNACPDVKIEILHESTPLLAEWVGSNLLDTAFITTPFDENTRKHNYHKKVLHRFNDTIIAGQAFSKLKGRVMTLGEIAEHPLICTKKGSETYAFYQHLFAQSGLEFKPTVETADTGQVLEYAAENLGIGVIHPYDAAKALR
ncbi:MAG: LysR family transcriptional regulator, partial [Lachnospiraceae bacterium]|nr:LysR family transcriptional regulator [Lachnospiraceae bacterium]